VTASSVATPSMIPAVTSATTDMPCVNAVCAAWRRLGETCPALVETALEVGANPLTARETDVLRAASEGGTTADIGRALFLSPATVRNYLSNAISKLDARNRIDAIRIARQSGWI
jgi:DNA-binding NarL/FixJ family response regulator